MEVVSLMNQIINCEMSSINQLLENLKKKKSLFILQRQYSGVDLADMQSLSKYNEGNKSFLYAWVVHIKDKNGTSVVNAFQKIVSEGRKPNKIWVDQGSELYNNSFKDILKMNKIEMYSTYNEGKSVVVERFIRTMKNDF